MKKHVVDLGETSTKVNFLQNRPRFKFFNSISDSLYFFAVEKPPFYKYFFASETCFLKMLKKCKIRPFYGVNPVKT